MTTTENVLPTLSLPKDELKRGLGTIIEYGFIDPKLLQVAETNNRTIPISEAERDEMDKSVIENGVTEAVILNMEDKIVSGQLRWQSALRTNQAEIPFVKMQFKDKYSERIFSMLQDDQHHRLEQVDLITFVKKCVAMHGKSIAQIAKSLGKDACALRSLVNSETIPSVIADDPKLVDKYNDLTYKRRNAVKSVLDKPSYKEDYVKAQDFINFALDAPLRELEQARKDACLGSPIDAKARKNRLKERTILIEVKIPQNVDKDFRNALKKNNKDYVVIIEKLITGYSRGIFDISLVE